MKWAWHFEKEHCPALTAYRLITFNEKPINYAVINTVRRYACEKLFR